MSACLPCGDRAHLERAARAFCRICARLHVTRLSSASNGTRYAEDLGAAGTKCTSNEAGRV
ncbi:hypothetical protein B0H14DRAFT_3509036 [Mycena olivaceomarginata]|nr:hypothetical protein B0H14DRAFT_3509036 [Mycena olivaceomarginata]